MCGLRVVMDDRRRDVGMGVRCRLEHQESGTGDDVTGGGHAEQGPGFQRHDREGRVPTA